MYLSTVCTVPNAAVQSCGFRCGKIRLLNFLLPAAIHLEESSPVPPQEPALSTASGNRLNSEYGGAALLPQLFLYRPVLRLSYAPLKCPQLTSKLSKVRPVLIPLIGWLDAGGLLKLRLLLFGHRTVLLIFGRSRLILIQIREGPLNREELPPAPWALRWDHQRAELRLHIPNPQMAEGIVTLFLPHFLMPSVQGVVGEGLAAEGAMPEPPGRVPQPSGQEP